MKKSILKKFVSTLIIVLLVLTQLNLVFNKSYAYKYELPEGTKLLLWSTKTRYDSDIQAFINNVTTGYQNIYEGQLTITNSVNSDSSRSTLPDLDEYALVFVILPTEAPTDAEIQQMKRYVNRGGRLVFIAENNGYARSQNAILSEIANKLGANFTIDDGSYGSPKFGYVSERNSASRLYSETIEQDYVAPILYSGDVEWVYKVVDPRYNNPNGSHDVVWCVDESAGRGKITVVSDVNWAENPTVANFNPETCYEFLRLLLEDSLRNIEQTVSIKNYEAGTTNPIVGSEISLCDKDGNILKDKNGNNLTVTTNENGYANFANKLKLVEGETYYYKQTKPASTYELNNNLYSFSVDENGEIKFNSNEGIIYNDKVKSIIKKCETGTTIPLEGAKIAICDENGNVLKDQNGNDLVVSTNKKGEADLAGLVNYNPGKHYYKEISPAKDYKLNENIYSFTIGNTGITSYGDNNNGITYDDRIKSTIRKYETGTTNPLQGVKIALCDENGNVLKDDNGKELILTTDEKGEVDFSKLVNYKPGKYYYKETETINGYKLNEKIYSFTINEDGSTTYSDNNNGITYDDKKENTVQPTPTPAQAPAKLPAAGLVGTAVMTLIFAISAIGIVLYRNYKKNYKNY